MPDSSEFENGFRAHRPLSGEDIERIKEQAAAHPEQHKRHMSEEDIKLARENMDRSISESVPWHLVLYVERLHERFPLRELVDEFSQYIQGYDCRWLGEKEQEQSNDRLFERMVCGILEGSMPSLSNQPPYPVTPMDFLFWIRDRHELVDRIQYTMRYVEYAKSKECTGQAATTKPERTEGSHFDVFMAHNSRDKPLVRTIAEVLINQGIAPWVDVDQIPPGRWFQEILQGAITDARSAAIFIGIHGVGRWEAVEIRSFMSQCIERGIPLIPVLLPGVAEIPSNLPFLRELHLVKFRAIDDQDALKQLIWGITGTKA